MTFYILKWVDIPKNWNTAFSALAYKGYIIFGNFMIKTDYEQGNVC